MTRHSFGSPVWRAVLLAGSVASLVMACGGKSSTDAFDDTGGSGGTGDSGGTGGTQGTAGPSSGGSGSTSVAEVTSSSASTSGGSTSAGSTSASSTSAGSTGGASSTDTVTTGGGPDERCALPLDAGTCDAYFQVYGYNVDTGRCEQFVYGGCGGNENRFDTLDDCQVACDHGDRTACESTPECVLDHGCCGFCGIDSVDQLVAVNQEYAGFTVPECGLIECEYCPPPAELGNYGARCHEGSCEVYDVRTSDLSACETDADCRLRAGLSCCEGCGGADWVAVSVDYERVEKELCGGAPVPCPACVPPPPPEDIAAICGADGHCAVSNLD